MKEKTWIKKIIFLGKVRILIKDKALNGDIRGRKRGQNLRNQRGGQLNNFKQDQEDSKTRENHCFVL